MRQKENICTACSTVQMMCITVVLILLSKLLSIYLSSTLSLPLAKISLKKSQPLRPHHRDGDAAGRSETSSVSNCHPERITARTSESDRRVPGPVRSVFAEGYIRRP